MSELCFSPTSRPHLYSLLKSDFFLFCSFILSHPLHSTFFIFFFVFSSYFHKILSFLFPLFITTSLFLLAFLTFIPKYFVNDNPSSEEVKVSFLTATYLKVVETLRSKIDNQREEFLRLEDFEVFRIVFDVNPTIHEANLSQVEALEAASCSQEAPESASLSPDEELRPPGKTELMEDDSKKLVEEFEDVKVEKSVEREKIAPSCTGANKATEKQGNNGGSEAGDKMRRNNSVGKEKSRDREYKSKLLKAHSHSIGASVDYTNDINNGDNYSLGSYGSMRKEKEWKRTLACKLFEERNNAEESEGMDLLWETYEADSGKKNSSSNISRKKNQKKDKKNKYEVKYHEEEEDEIEAEDDLDGQLCCLQALKFSTGKMNLGMGMGKPNLVKITKAIKGIGWLQSLRKHSKKVHNGDKY